MLETDILTIVIHAFDDNIVAEAWDDYGSAIPVMLYGREDFLNKVKEELNKLFEDNDFKDAG